MAGFNVNIRNNTAPLGGAEVGSNTSSVDALLALRNRMNNAGVPMGIPGADAAQQARDIVAPTETPVVPFPQEGLVGVKGMPPLTEQSDNMEQAQAAQSSLATTNLYKTGEFNPETGDYSFVPETLGERADERERQLSTLTDASAFVDPNMSPAAAAQSVMQSRAEGAQVSEIARKITGVADPKNSDRLSAWADSMGPSIAVEQTKTMDYITNGVGSTEPGFESVPEGLVVLNRNGLADENGVQAVSTILGLAGLVAANQMSTFKSDDQALPTFDSTGRPMEDARPMVNYVNSIAAAAKTAMERAGIDMPMDDVRKLANVQAMGELMNGNAIISRDNKDNTVIKANDKIKKAANKTEYLREALFGANNRPGVSYTTNIAGSSYINPGSQTTQGSLSRGGKTAELVKHVLGQMEFVYRPKDVLYKELQLKDITSKVVMSPMGTPMYSESGFAKEANVSKADYEKLRERLAPPANYNPKNQEQYRQYEAAKDAHASEEIQNKLETLAYDIETAKTINKVFRITHAQSTANHRYFEMTKGADALSSKYGVREMRNVAQQDVTKPTYLFDPMGVQRVKEAAKQLFAKKGQARHDALVSMDLPLRSAIGLMLNATINYYTAINPDAGVPITKMIEADIIDKYTPVIGGHLADIGREYNEWLADPDKASDRIKGLLYGIPRGEALGNKNLWDDMFQLATSFTDPAKKQTTTTLSYLSFDDGNQNGIFFQGLLFGVKDNVIRLGTLDPTQSDMRGYAGGVLADHLDSLLEDRPEQLDAFKQFFKAAKAKGSLNSDLFKKPLMQNSYGMDASMFFDHVYDFLNDPKYQDDVMKLLNPVFDNDIMEIAHTLNMVLETTLRQVVDQEFAQNMSEVGRYAAVLNTPLHLPGPDGDMMELTPTGIMPIMDPSKDQTDISTDDHGNPVDLVQRGVKTMDVTTQLGGSEIASTPIGTTQANPAKKKPDQVFWSKRDEKWTTFKNYAGGALARYFVVMPVQAIDGSVLGLTILAANKHRLNKGAPIPASFVHDGISSTGSGSMIYRNAYNNIAIPQAIPEIAKFGEHLEKAIKEAKKIALEKASKLPLIGIGADGHFPALSAVFDEIFDKVQDGGPYHERFIERKVNSIMAKGKHISRSEAEATAAEAWDRYTKVRREILGEAQSLGWKAEGTVAEHIRANLGVKYDQFTRLLELAESVLNIDGTPINPKQQRPNFKQFVANFKSNVMNTANQLLNNVNVKKGGIYQMSPGGGKPAAKALTPSGKAIDWTKRLQPRDNTVPATEKHSGERKVKQAEFVSPAKGELSRSVMAGLRGRDFKIEDLIDAINSTPKGSEARKAALEPFFNAIEHKIDDSDTTRGSYYQAYNGLVDAIDIDKI